MIPARNSTVHWILLLGQSLGTVLESWVTFRCTVFVVALRNFKTSIAIELINSFSAGKPKLVNFLTKFIA